MPYLGWCFSVFIGFKIVYAVLFCCVGGELFSIRQPLSSNLFQNYLRFSFISLSFLHDSSFHQLRPLQLEHAILIPNNCITLIFSVLQMKGKNRSRYLILKNSPCVVAFLNTKTLIFKSTVNRYQSS